MSKIIPVNPARIGNTFKIDFSIIRLLDRRIVSSNIEFSAELDINDEASAEEQVKVLSSMRKWFDGILDGCIAFCPANEISQSTLEALDNNLMFCPDDPYDHLLLTLLVAKINAIGSGTMRAVHSHLRSNLGEGFGNWFEGDPDDVLPSLTEWLGPTTYFDKPWWHRSDGSMLDLAVGEGMDPAEKPDILVDLWETVPHAVTNREPAEIIKPNFNLTIVKDD